MRRASLICWIQPDGAIISPNHFIPLAEKTGFITGITKAMLPKAVNKLATDRIGILLLPRPEARQFIFHLAGVLYDLIAPPV